MSLSETVQGRWQQWRAGYPRRRIERTPKDIEWGKRLFSDTTSASEHLRGRMFWARARLLGGKRSTPAGVESRRKGLRVIGPIAPPDVVKSVTEKVRAVLSTPREDDYRYKGTLVSRSIVFAAREVPELKKLITPTMLDAVREYYGSNFRLLHLSAWRNWAAPPITLAEEVYSNNWHTDGRRVDMVKVFVTASDVTEDDGPTHALTREWTREIVKRGFDDRRNYGLPVETIENPEHLVRLTGPAGTAMLCNTNLCFHRAGLVGEGRQRDIIEYRFISSPSFSLDMPDDESLPWKDRIIQNY